MIKTFPGEDCYFNFGLKSFIESFKPVLPAPVDQCYFVKLDIDSLVYILSGNLNFKSVNGFIVLVTSCQCLPLAKFFTRLTKANITLLDLSKIYLTDHPEWGNTVEKNSKQEVLTEDEYKTLSLSLKSYSPVFLGLAKRKRFYAQRANALRKLKINKMISIFLWQGAYR